jgi:hypothetical protein
MRASVVQLFLAEAAVLLVIAPLAGVFTALGVRSRCAGIEAGTLFSRMLTGAVWLLRGLLVRVTALVGASLIIALLAGTAMDTAALLRFHAVLWAAAMTMAALGAVCASACREPLDGAACAVGVAVLATAGVFVAGPALDNSSGHWLDVLLLANPLVASAATADIDVFRMHPFYQLSSIAHRQFDYPAAAAALATYAVTAAVLLLIAARQTSVRGSALSVERISS